MKFRNQRHKELFNGAIRRLDKQNNTLMAVVYLFTADNRLWSMTRHGICYSGVDFNHIRLRNCSVGMYTLYACASGMSFLSTDTKGDVMRNYGNIAKQYGYHVSIIDLRNPTRSNGNNLLHLVNKYMDLHKEKPKSLVYKAKAEKFAKIISKTIILSGMDAASFGQNAYFYDAAEGLLTATILLVAEFCEPKKRHKVPHVMVTGERTTHCKRYYSRE